MKQHNLAHVLLALDALNFDAGDWKPESIERHLHEQIALARKHLQSIVDNEPPAGFVCVDQALITEQLMSLQARCNYEDTSANIHDAIVQLINTVSKRGTAK